MYPSLDSALANFSTGSSRFFLYQPMTKTLDLDELQKRLTHHKIFIYRTCC